MNISDSERIKVSILRHAFDYLHVLPLRPFSSVPFHLFYSSNEDGLVVTGVLTFRANERSLHACWSVSTLPKSSASASATVHFHRILLSTPAYRAPLYITYSSSSKDSV